MCVVVAEWSKAQVSEHWGANDPGSIPWSGYVTALCLLDLSAAFDTVNYDILLARLKNTYGFVGLIIKWLRTYLENHVFHVQFNGEHSSSTILTCGVPQGLVLRLLLFVMYTAQLEDITRKHNYQSHMNADDNQYMYIVATRM